MSFFKEFKEDFSQAVNELMPGETEGTELDGAEVNTLDEDVDLKAELDKLDDIWASDVKDKKASDSLFVNFDENKDNVEEALETIEKEAVLEKEETAEKESTVKKESTIEKEKPNMEAPKMETNEVKMDQETAVPEGHNNFVKKPVESTYETNEVAVITKGMVIHGDVEAAGPIEVRGIVNGNIKSNGKIVVTGTLKGDASSKEFFADNAQMDGEIITEGTVKIGNGSIIKGNITATSSVIAGAVKGDIDVHGPVIVDTSAIVMGNIKSESVQINNGAVIEGYCSQCYANIDVKNLFGEE